MSNSRVEDRVREWASRVLAGTIQAGLAAGVLTFGASAQTAPAPPMDDARVQSAVTQALAGDAQLRGQQVTATVAQGVVTLKGSVGDDAQRVAAEQTAAQVAGVRSIDDGIVVGGQGGQPPADAKEAPESGNGAQGSGQGGQGSAMPPPPPADTDARPQQGQGGPYGQQPPQSGSAQQGQYPQQQGQYPQQLPQSGPVQQGQFGPMQQGQYPQQQGQYPEQQGQYPEQQGQYGSPPAGQYPAARPGQYAPYPQDAGRYAPPPPPSYVPGVTPDRQNTSGPVTLSPGLLLSVRTSEPLSTGALKGGEFVQFTAAADLYASGIVAIPRGAVLTGEVVEAKNAGPFGGSPRLDLKLTTLTLGNRSYPLGTDVWTSQGPSKTGYTAANTVGGAAFGALIGAVAGGGVGAGVGAIAGGTGGALVSGATHGPRLDVPAEALLQFHLTAPLTVQPVHYDEAERLAASVPQQPVLRPRTMYVRAPYPYYARPYYARPYYGYPAPYPYRVY